MGKLSTLWINLKSSLWFVPTLLIAATVGLGFGLIELDSHFSLNLQQRWPRFFGVSAEGSRSMLETIAGAMIGVAGVSFSITIVTLSLAANQYTPRVLRNFMRDRGNQVVLGGLVSIFLYCLVVLRTIQGGEGAFTPVLSVVGAMILALGGIGLFIYFIHHIAATIQVSSILSSISAETVVAVRTMFPEKIGNQPDDLITAETDQTWLQKQAWVSVPAQESGYLQTVDVDSLLKLAHKHQTVIRLEARIGGFVMAGAPVAWVSAQGHPATESVRRLHQALGINSYRTIEQDPAYGIRQIVDIALKALSPGINDPTTAINCLDYLGAILRVLIRRRIPSPYRYFQGSLRLIVHGPTLEELLDEMLHEIRLHARNHFFVVSRLLQLLERASVIETAPLRRDALWLQARLICSEACHQLTTQEDRERVQAQVDRIAVVLGKTFFRPNVASSA